MKCSVRAAAPGVFQKVSSRSSEGEVGSTATGVFGSRLLFSGARTLFFANSSFCEDVQEDETVILFYNARTRCFRY